jgi:hypothetical protein
MVKAAVRLAGMGDITVAAEGRMRQRSETQFVPNLVVSSDATNTSSPMWCIVRAVVAGTLHRPL